MGEIIISIIAALGGTAGIVSIIGAIKSKSQDNVNNETLCELIQNALNKELTSLSEPFTKINKQLDKQQASNIALLRHHITEIYYKGLEKKALPAYDKESVIMMAETYYSLGGNSYIHSIVDEIKTWETTKE